MKPYYADDSVTLYHGDCLDVLRELPDASVDAVVTDPPYGLGFMGREWDDLPPGLPFAQECLRVLKPGGYILAFGGSRTWHRLASAAEDAGFEIRDSIAWLYGSGFPKSLDVSKAIDRARDDNGEIAKVQVFLNQVRLSRGLNLRDVNSHFCAAQTGGGLASKWMTNISSPAVPTWEQWLNLKEWLAFDDSMDALVRDLNERKGEGSDEWRSRPNAEYNGRPGMAQSWRDGEGWTGAAAKGGAAVRPAARQWQGWGTALKPAFEPIVVGRKPFPGTVAGNVLEHGTGALNIDGCRVEGAGAEAGRVRHGGGTNSVYQDQEWSARTADRGNEMPAGRWPTNVVLDESQAAELDRQTGMSVSRSGGMSGTKSSGGLMNNTGEARTDARGGHDDSGGASRFFPTFRYEAKAPASERPRDGATAHPTVKPLDLMRWLVRLVTPPAGTVLEPFAGSGTTAEACVIEGFKCIAIEREADYLPLIVNRLSKPIQIGLDFGEPA